MGNVKTFRFFLYDAFKWIGRLAFRRFGRRDGSGTCAFDLCVWLL